MLSCQGKQRFLKPVMEPLSEQPALTVTDDIITGAFGKTFGTGGVVPAPP